MYCFPSLDSVQGQVHVQQSKTIKMQEGPKVEQVGFRAKEKGHNGRQQ